MRWRSSSRATTRRTRRRRRRSRCTAGISFIAAGLIALYRRPENRTGVYLAAVGYLWFLGALAEANNDGVYTLGVVALEPRLHPVRRARARLPDRPARAEARPPARADHGRLRADRPAAAAAVREAAARLRRECGDSAIVVVESPTTETIVDSVGTAVTVGIIVGGRRRARPALAAGDAGAAPHARSPCTSPAARRSSCCSLGNVLAQVSTAAVGRDRAAVPPVLRRGAVRVPARDPAQPSRARLGRRARRLDRAGHAAARRDRRRARRPDARARLPARGGTAIRRPRRPRLRASRARLGARRLDRRARRPARRCARPRRVAVRRARARRERLGGGRARARQRAARDGAARAVRLPHHDRRHGAEPARQHRHRRRDPQPQPGDRRGERLRRRRARCAAATSGTSSSTTASARR